MDELPSRWPLRYKLLAVALLIAVLLIVRWAIAGFVHQLPDYWLDLLVTATFAFCFGWLFGERAATKRIEHEGHGNALSSDPE
jgi:hypothetical protein